MARRCALLAIAGLAGCSGFRTHGTPVPVPITITTHRELLVDIEIDGQRFVFQLDTGASRTTITPQARDRLELPIDIMTSGHGAGGAIDRVGLAHIGTAIVGNRRFGQLTVAVIDLSRTGGSKLDGMLGQDVLGFLTSELDLRARRLVMHHDEDRSWNTPDLVAIPYTTVADGLIRLEVALHDRPAAAILDLGAATTVASSRAIGDLVGSYAAMTVGVDGHPIRASGLHDVTIDLGAIELRAPTMLVADLPVFDRFDIHDRPPIILGVDALEARKLVIAPHEQRVYISRR